LEGNATRRQTEKEHTIGTREREEREGERERERARAMESFALSWKWVCKTAQKREKFRF
jgi:hypothetical protein